MQNDADRTIAETARTCSRIIAELERVVVGKRAFLERLLCAFIARGHVLIEDYPGLAKTMTAISLARTTGLVFKRIQFTPDLLPADVTGSHIYNATRGDFQLVRGPLFANVVLADEINRAPPKTQAGLLEAMQERSVTLDGTTMELPEPFLVIATQNPIEYEGTFPLPEAQLDRFMVKLSIGYPSQRDEIEILQRRAARGKDDVDVSPVCSPEELIATQTATERVFVHADIAAYIVRLVARTRTAPHVEIGAGPRASLALLKLAQAHAVMDGRSFVVPDDVKFLAEEVIAHRMILLPEVAIHNLDVRGIVRSLIDDEPVPTVEGEAS